MRIRLFLSNLFGIIAAIFLVCAVSVSCVNHNLEELSRRVNTSTTSTTESSTSSTGTTSTSTTTGTTTTGTTTTTTTTTTVSFTNDIKPMLVKYNCNGCHGSTYVGYSRVSTWAKSGALYGMLSGASGYRKMPPSQTVSASDLALVSTWIKEGILNN